MAVIRQDPELLVSTYGGVEGVGVVVGVYYRAVIGGSRCGDTNGKGLSQSPSC